MNARISRRSSTFTLIELLVVVAIIALLISVLLPSLAKARELCITFTLIELLVVGALMKTLALALFSVLRHVRFRCGSSDMLRARARHIPIRLLLH